MSNNTRATLAAINHLQEHGYVVIDVDACTFDLVAIIDGGIAFIDVNYCDEAIKSSKRTRRSFEENSIAYMANYDEAIPYRYDLVTITRTSDDHAVLKHHVNAMLDSNDMDKLESFMAENPDLSAAQIAALLAFVEYVE